MHLVGFYYKNISRCTVLWMSNWTSDVRSRSRSSSDLDSKVWLFKSQISIKFTFLYYLYILVDISCNEYSPNQKKTIKKGKTSFKSLSTLWLSRRRRSRNPKIQRNCAKIFCIEAHPDRSINEEWTGRKLIILNDDQQDATILVYLFIPNQSYMFRAMSSPIIRSTWLYLQLPI